MCDVTCGDARDVRVTLRANCEPRVHESTGWSVRGKTPTLPADLTKISKIDAKAGSKAPVRVRPSRT